MATNTIQQRGNYRLDEDVASVLITPGMLIELTTSTGRKVKPHATEGGYAELAFAVEDPLQGATATSVESRTIDTDYAIADRVTYHIQYRGSVVFAFLKAGENVAIGDKLISAGDGSLIKNGSEASGTTVRQVVAIAEVALDLSASGAVKLRLNVRAL